MVSGRKRTALMESRTLMAMKAKRVDTWAASMKDKPGSVAAKLRALAGAGVNLEFVIARRTPERRGAGVVFVTPIQSAAGKRAARKSGFRKTTSLHTVRIEGPDRKGACARIAEALAANGLNLRGLSAAAVNRKFVAHVALDSNADAAKAMRILRGL